MHIEEIIDYIESLFTTRGNENFKLESGLTYNAGHDVNSLAYCTNLTLDTIEKARELDVSLIITHHDAWDFLYGLKEDCLTKLKEYGISHYYNHLPLDDCNFGTNDSLCELLGLNILERTHMEDGFLCGRITEPNETLTFEALVERTETVLGEPVQAWKFNNKAMGRIGIVCGGGGLSTDVNVAVEKKCDTYLTAEKTLYTIEQAQHQGMNLIIGSHTFTEIFGVESLAKKISSKYPALRVKKINERRLETDNRVSINN